MPNFEAHKKIGFIVSIIFSLILVFLFNQQFPLSGWNILIALFTVYVYSNIPDLDHHMGRLRKSLFKVIFLLLFLSFIIVPFLNIWNYLLILTFIGALGIIIMKLKHRGITHKYTFAFIVSLPLFYFHWFIWAVGFLSCFSHIFVDRWFSKTKRKFKKFFGLGGNTYEYNIKIKL